MRLEELGRQRIHADINSSGTDFQKFFAGWKNAQTQRQQDPAPEVAVAVVVVLKLLTDLTVNLISENKEMNDNSCVLKTSL